MKSGENVGEFMKIDESRLPSVLRVLSLCSQVCIFVTFSFILIIELEFFDAWKYPISFFLVVVVLVSFGVGCLGASVIFCNLSAVRSRRPDFMLLVFICLLPMAGAQYVYGIQNLSFAAINDVSTNVDDPPEFRLSRSERQRYSHKGGIWSWLDATNTITAHKDISSITLLASPDIVYQCALVTVQRLNWRVTARDPLRRVFEAKAVVPYIDKETDAVIRVLDSGQGYSVIDARSASPNGRMDGGLNAQIITLFLNQLKPVLVDRRVIDHC